MSSLDSIQTRQALARGEVVQLGDDSSVAIRLRYVGTGTVTSVTTTTGTNIVMVTSDGGTDTYAFATYTTVGSLVDAINADGIFEARVLDALRSDATASKFVDGAITAGADANGVVIWDVLGDTSAQDTATAALVGDRNWDGKEDRIIKVKELSYNQNVSAAEAGAVRLYRRRGANEELIYSTTSVDATNTTINWASGEGFISGIPGDEFIFRVVDGTSITDADANYVRIVGTVE